jgi:putative sugar O-methyltransferase
MATWSREFSKALTQLDAVGNPRKYRFANYGTISPTLLRYLKVYLDLKRLFGPMDGKRISEIGIGFGGQAGLITILDQPAQYSLFDIPPVLELTQKYLRSIEVNGNFEALDGRVPKIIETDLVISNYAFSELNRKIQEEYLKNVILRSKMGYITWNNLSQTQLGGYSLAELIRRIPDSEVIPETPLTAVSNVILMWNRTKN